MLLQHFLPASTSFVDAIACDRETIADSGTFYPAAAALASNCLDSRVTIVETKTWRSGRDLWGWSLVLLLNRFSCFWLSASSVTPLGISLGQTKRVGKARVSRPHDRHTGAYDFYGFLASVSSLTYWHFPCSRFAAFLSKSVLGLRVRSLRNTAGCSLVLRVRYLLREEVLLQRAVLF